MIMDIEDIEIGCDGCRTTITKRDDCYCETCIDKKDEEIRDLEKRIESLEGELSASETEVMNLKKEGE